MLEGFTYGAEYEFGDIQRKELPDGLTWNTKDYSIVSSSGIANDPKGKAYTRGGEINSRPTATINEQLDMFNQLVYLRPEAKLNHRTNLHLHIRVPNLKEDLKALKTLLTYVDTYQEETYTLIEPIPAPVFGTSATLAEQRGAKTRYKRRKVSHQYKVSKERVKRALQANSVEEFFAAHAPVQADGKPAWGLTTRAGINLLQLKETDTIEFRHFTNTLDVHELECCFIWVHNFMNAALTGSHTPAELFKEVIDWHFPPFQPYNHAMEVGYQWTNFDKNSRKVATERINELREHFDLDVCTAEEIAPWIVSQSAGKLSL
jgi:hypothetical protein